jgi:hypothetical protein
MGEITQGIDGFFFLSLTTLICGGLTLLIRFAYKSKCKSVELCCIKIDRDIENEVKEDLNLSPSSPNIAADYQKN